MEGLERSEQILLKPREGNDAMRAWIIFQEDAMDKLHG